MWMPLLCENCGWNGHLDRSHMWSLFISSSILVLEVAVKKKKHISHQRKQRIWCVSKAVLISKPQGKHFERLNLQLRDRQESNLLLLSYLPSPLHECLPALSIHHQVHYRCMIKPSFPRFSIFSPFESFRQILVLRAPFEPTYQNPSHCSNTLPSLKRITFAALEK